MLISRRIRGSSSAAQPLAADWEGGRQTSIRQGQRPLKPRKGILPLRAAARRTRESPRSKMLADSTQPAPARGTLTKCSQGWCCGGGYSARWCRRRIDDDGGGGGGNDEKAQTRRSHLLFYAAGQPRRRQQRRWSSHATINSVQEKNAQKRGCAAQVAIGHCFISGDGGGAVRRRALKPAALPAPLLLLLLLCMVSAGLQAASSVCVCVCWFAPIKATAIARWPATKPKRQQQQRRPVARAQKRKNSLSLELKFAHFANSTRRPSQLSPPFASLSANQPVGKKRSPASFGQKSASVCYYCCCCSNRTLLIGTTFMHVVVDFGNYCHHHRRRRRTLTDQREAPARERDESQMQCVVVFRFVVNKCTSEQEPIINEQQLSSSSSSR